MTTVAAVVLTTIFLRSSPLLVRSMTLPLAIQHISMITSIIGTFFVELGASQWMIGALPGLIATGIIWLAASPA